MRKVAKKVSKLSLFSQLSAPIKSGVKNILDYSTNKQQIRASGTTFSTFSDDVRLDGGHGNCCRFATITGVHQGAHICLAKLCFKGKVRSYDSRAELRNVLQEKWRCRGGSSCRFDRKVGIFFCGQCNTGGLQPPDLAFLQCTKSVLIRRYIRRGLLVNQTQ